VVQSSGMPVFFTPSFSNGFASSPFPQGSVNTSPTIGVPNFAGQMGFGVQQPFTSAGLTQNAGASSNLVMAISQLSTSLNALLQQLAALTGQQGVSPIVNQPQPVQQQAPVAATPSRSVAPDAQTARVLLSAYVNSASSTTPDLDVRRLMQESGNKGISSLALGYGSEIKAATANIVQNPNTTFNGVTNRATNPAGLLPFMNFDSSGADQFLEAMMVYKNGTYNNGVFGQYDLPKIVQVYQQLVGPLTPEAQRNAMIDERIGMGLVYQMMRLGAINPNQEVRPDGSSVHGLWPNTARNNQAYLNAFRAVSSGTLANDLALEAAGRGGETLGKVDAYLQANQLGLNQPERL
jgi:hypothetical protein